MQSWLLELSVIGHKNGSAIEVSAVVDKFRILLLEINKFFLFGMRSIRSVGDWMNNTIIQPRISQEQINEKKEKKEAMQSKHDGDKIGNLREDG